MWRRPWVSVWEIVREAASDWWTDGAMRWAASVTFYTIFSLAPILVIAVSVAGFFFGREAASGELVHQVEGLIGSKGAEVIRSAVMGAQDQEAGKLATALGAVVLLVAATGVFIELQDALNAIWEVEAKPGWDPLAFLRDRLLSFALVVAIGFLLLVSLVFSAGLAAFSRWVEARQMLPGGQAVWRGVDLVGSIGAVTLLFAITFKWLPDAKIRWRDVWLGALATGALFTAGKFGIGLYIGRSTTASAYGAAGSLVVLLIWVYYSVQILLFGAEITQVYARRRGEGIVPVEYAEPQPTLETPKRER